MVQPGRSMLSCGTSRIRARSGRNRLKGVETPARIHPRARIVGKGESLAEVHHGHAATCSMLAPGRQDGMHAISDPASQDLAARHDSYPDSLIRAVLRTARSIALVGASANPVRPSYIVFKYLSERGFKVTPVNPGLAGKTLLGRPVIARLSELTGPVDMVEIFRNSEAAGPLVDEALALPTPPKVIWMQLGVRNDAAAARAEASGLTVIMNRCPKIEFGRLSGEIGWAGVNSRIISAKRPKLDARGVQRLTIEDR